jgi:hypothetical protein
MNKALLCIARQRSFVLKDAITGESAIGTLTTETEYSVSLNNMYSVPLKSSPKVYLIAGQTIKFYEWNPDVPSERYRVSALSYLYGFTAKPDSESEEVELLMFQWRREPDPSNDYPLGHLHIGPGLLSKSSLIRPKDFHKAHIPTERLSFEAVVRFAITELGVRPERQRWQATLAASERTFRDHATA